MAQTPQQRRANEKYAKTVEKRAGKPESVYKKKETSKSPVGTAVVALLIFVVVIPLLLEPLKLIPTIWNFILNILSRIGIYSR